MKPLPVPGERYKLHEFTREVVAVDTAARFGVGCVTFRIRLGDKAETHLVSLPTWNKWAEKAQKEERHGA